MANLKTGEYIHKIDKSQIPTCNILGVNIAAVNMDYLLDFTNKHIKALTGDYLCVSNVHTTIESFENKDYCAVQNGGIMAIPDGGPLAFVGRRLGFDQMERITGADYMDRIFNISVEKRYTHYFYGSTNDVLVKLHKQLNANYPGIQIVGMYSPPFRPLTQEEDKAVSEQINEAAPDFVWIGLGAPKQEKWMAEHQGKINGFMVGVGAGFNYLAGNISRAPIWMQKSNLEWLYRLIQEPKRLYKRYLHSNPRFIWYMLTGR